MLGYLLIFGAVLMTVTTLPLEDNEELGNDNLGELDASVEEPVMDSEEVEEERGSSTSQKSHNG